MSTINQILVQTPQHPILFVIMILFVILVLTFLFQYLQSKNCRVGEISTKRQQKVKLKTKKIDKNLSGRIFFVSFMTFWINLVFLELSVVFYYAKKETLLMMFSSMFGVSFAMTVILLYLLSKGYKSKK